MRSEQKKYLRKIILVLTLLTSGPLYAQTESFSSAFTMAPEWHVGAGFGGGWVPAPNVWLKGSNPDNHPINKHFSVDLRGGFNFNRNSRIARRYPGLYQGIGVGVNFFDAPKGLGTPISTYVYQGAPIVNFNSHFRFGYEWQFGAASGWKHNSSQDPHNHSVTSTAITAHMGLAFKFSYEVSKHVNVALGVEAHHFSNGNTSWPNNGVNSLGASASFVYFIQPQSSASDDKEDIDESSSGRKWFYDITAYGAWRKRIVEVGDPVEQELCPGKFGIVGLQFSPMYRINRWVAVGPGLDMQWDESAGLPPYWVKGSYWENIKFQRPPFIKQLSIGASAHAELTTPLFAVNAALGYDFLSPVGNKHFFQSLTLKTFITDNLFLNIGYRLGKFRDPQNLMLGVGVRL